MQIVKTKQAQEGEIVCQGSLDGQIVFCMFVHLQENLSRSYYVTAQAVAQRYNNKRREHKQYVHNRRWADVGCLKMQKVFEAFCIFFYYAETFFGILWDVTERL